MSPRKTKLEPRSTSIPRSLIKLHNTADALVRERLWLQVLAGMLLGLVVGFALTTEANLVSRSDAITVARWLALPGNLFLAAIKFVVVPLVAASVIRGITATGSADTLRRLGSRIVFYFLLTTTLAVPIGSGVAYLIQPGAYVSGSLLNATLGQIPAAEIAQSHKSNIPDAIVALIPTNPYETLVAGDMLQIVIAATIIGVAAVCLPDRHTRPFLDLLASIQMICMVIVKWVLRFAPVAVFGLIAQITSRVGLDAIVGVAAYVVTVIIGLGALLAFYSALVTLVSKCSPVRFFGSIREVMLLAFSTSSSATVMPVTLKIAEEKLGIDPAVSRFVVPLGTTINMDGTALYQSVAAIFLAQVFGVDIGLQGIMLILITSIGASIGTPGTPGVGIVILATILSAVGIPSNGIALLLGVDRILDMCRTAVNVTGDLTACTVINRLLGNGFHQFQPIAATCKPKG